MRTADIVQVKTTVPFPINKVLNKATFNLKLSSISKMFPGELILSFN